MLRSAHAVRSGWKAHRSRGYKAASDFPGAGPALLQVFDTPTSSVYMILLVFEQS